MKNSIKLISLALTLALCVFVVMSVSAQETELSNPVDTFEYKVLKGLGVTDADIDGLAFGSAVSRGQYAHMLAGLMGYNGQNTVSDDFIDIKDSQYKGAVYFLKDRGIVSGVNSYQFKPDDPITFETAVVMSVRAMGYEELAKIKYGSGTDAFLIMAQSLDIADGIENSGEYLSAEDAFVILKNTATEPMLLQETYGDDMQFNNRDNTILSVYRDIYVSYGKMTDNGITALDGGSAVSEGRVVIDGHTLLCRDFASAKDFVGMNVEYYTKDNSLVCAVPYDNEIVIVDSANLDKTGTTVNNVPYYTEKGKRKNLSLDLNSSMIYNSYAHPYFKADDLKIDEGQLVFVNNDGDSDFDVVVVREYRDYIVGGLSDGVLSAGGKTIDFDDYLWFCIYDENGNVIMPEDVVSDAVATVYESYDKKAVEIYISTKKSEGTVTEKGETDAGQEYYLADGVKYIPSVDYRYGLQNGLLNAVEIEVGGSYRFSLNIYGKVVKAEAVQPGKWRIAYCVGIKADKSSMDGRVRANLVMSDGTVFQPYFSQRVALNEGKRDRAELLLESDLFYSSSGEPLRQPVKVKLDAQGNITDILVPQDKTDTPFGFDTSVFSYDRYVASGLYRGSSKRAINNCILTTETVIFEDPYYNKEGNTFMTEKIKAYTALTFPAEASLSAVRFYDLDEGMRADIMVYATKDITPGNELLFVDNITKTLDKNGDEIKRVSGYSQGVYKVYMEREAGCVPDSIKKGDVCKFSVEGNDIASISKIISLGKGTKPYADGTVINAKWANIYGYLYSKTANSVVVVAPETYKDSALIGTSLGAGAKVTVYDLELDRIYPGTMADVYTDFVPDNQGNYQLSDSSTMVYIYRQYDFAKEIIVVKK